MADPNGTLAEETTPDLLKNTPTNIALLEDVIEQSEGRRKYHAQTRSPSDGNDVRWYFCKVPLADNELAASVPRSEIVGKGDYFRFGMRDSLAIEAAFLQREEELLSSWWKEYAECSEGPSRQATSSKDLDKQKNAFSKEKAEARRLYDVEEDRVGVPVKGGLYEVDLVNRHCFPVYWSGENRRVLRGHWFARKGGLDWLPLREDVAEQLEMAYRKQVWHRRTFQPSGLFAARVNLQGSGPGLHALFTGEDDTWEAWLNVDASGFSSIVNFSGNRIKLRRGFSVSISAKLTQDEIRQQKEEEMDDYCSQVPVGHLVFMVHGIGQRLEKSNLVDDVGNHRQITANLAERHLSSHQRGAQRVLFIPCQWRKGLKLSGEAAVDKITLDGVRGLRVTLSATVHDVLYYMSPIYCQDIIDSVSNQLNMLYLKFLKRNPGYHGKVSLYGHSLGSVLSYDILCHQETLSSPFPMDWMFREHARTDDSSMNRHEHSSRSEFSNIMEGNHPQKVTQSKLDGNLHEDAMTSANLHMVPHNEQAEAPSPVASDSCPTAELVTNSGQRTAEGDVIHEPIHEGGDIVCEEGLLDEATRTKLNNLSHGLEQTGKEYYCDVDTKDRYLAMLQEEINSLKAKINELESQCSSSDASSSLQQDETLHNQHKLKKTAGLNDSTKSYTPYIRYTRLEFKVDTFFAVGSPIGVFLALRNIRVGIGKGQDYWLEENISEEMPACRRMFNIFHPFDPVAYRIEPLVCKEFVSNRPVIIPYHRGGKRLHIGFQEFAEDLAYRSQAILDHLNFVKIKVLTICQTRSLDGLEDEPNNIEHDEERTYGSIMMERLTGSQDGRIDYMLQDKTFEHPYLQALGAHTNYWRDKDTALFILKHLYKDIPEEADTNEDPCVSASKCESSLPAWSDQRDVDEEDLPLTFSDRMAIKSFSGKAKKLLKKR